MEQPWMRDVKLSTDRPTPLPTTERFNKEYLSAVGDPSPDIQQSLQKKMGCGYRNVVGELTYAMVTCRPDISYATIKAAQSSACPDRIHFEGVCHTMRYLYATRHDGLYFWRSSPNDSLPDISPPTVSSNPGDMMLPDRPVHDPYVAHGYVDSDWAADPHTCRSFTRICLRLAGGTIAFKSRLQPTVAQSSTEAEFMAACDAGKMILFVCSILFDLGIPQHAASILYEDNQGCISMANAGKPTSQTRHMDIKYHVICEWVERDLMILERVPTSQNLSDHFTKNLPKILFHRHVDFIMGHVPPPHSPLFAKFMCEDPPPPLSLKHHPPAAQAARLAAPYHWYLDRASYTIKGVW